MSIPVITVDGPSGVGKGTLASYLSKQTGYHFLDSGAIYRVLGLASQIENINIELVLENDTIKQELVNLAKNLPIEFIDGKILYKNTDISTKIRTEEIASLASKVAAINEIRVALLQRQKDFAQLPGLVADGRDMGTIVFPTAKVKFFLTASAEVRAKRRMDQLKNKNNNVNITKIIQDINLRDERDRNRSSSPLVAAFDAIIIDTSNLTITEVCVKAMSHLKT